jgi:hypothetical protein
MSLRIKAGYSLLDRIFLESEITDNKKNNQICYIV